MVSVVVPNLVAFVVTNLDAARQEVVVSIRILVGDGFPVPFKMRWPRRTAGNFEKRRMTFNPAPTVPLGAEETPATLATRFGIPERVAAIVAGWGFERGWNAALDADDDRPVTTLA